MSGLEDAETCPTCGARNGPDAAWCTQCWTPLGAEEAPSPAPPPPPPTGLDGEADGAPDGLLPLPPPAPRSPALEDDGSARQLRAGGGRFRETVEGLEWVCATCGEWNPIERITCSVCGAAFGRSLGAEEPPRPEVAPALLVGASLLLPGAGHWLLGLRGAAVLRALLGVVWGAGGLALLLQARGTGQSLLPAVPLLLGWAVVAAGTANDAVVEGGGEGSIVLSGRTLLWLTLAVVGGTFVAVVVGVLSAVGG